MKIAQVVAALDSRKGGPSRSVRATAEALAARGHQVDLLTTAEGNDTKHDTGVAVRSFRRGAPAMIAASKGLRRHLAENDYEVIHSHGLWTRHLAYAWQAADQRGSSLVISPRGMLAPWALRHHGLRKKVANLVVHPGALRGADGWHATSPGELTDINAAGYTQPACVAPNGVVVPTETELDHARRWWIETEPRFDSAAPVVLFHSRFHKKKRVREMLDLWAALPDTGWVLALVGIPEDYTVEELRDIADTLGAGGRVIVADGTHTPPPYALANLFVLPTHSENFGLVVAESLAAGVPAIVTDTAPWAALDANGAGCCVAWDDFGETLAAAMSTPLDELAAMGARGREWAGKAFSWQHTAQLLEEFYKSLL